MVGAFVNKLLVSIPAFNEEATISQQVKQIKESCKRYNLKILVVDDGSTDNTARLAREAGAIVVSHRVNRGLAETFRTEMKEALKLNPGIIVHIDADLQYRAEEIHLLVNKLKEGNDLVLGSRFSGQIEAMPWIKRIGNMAFSKVISGITHQKITDGQTGFRVFTPEVAKLNIFSNHTYTQEQIIRAVKNNFSITEVAVHFDKRDGKSRLISNPFEYAAKAWVNILRTYRDFAPLKFFGLIGLFMFLVGSVLGLYFVFLHFTTGIQGHLGLLILMSLLLLSGIQIILFGFLADAIKNTVS